MGRLRRDVEGQRVVLRIGAGERDGVVGRVLVDADCIGVRGRPVRDRDRERLLGALRGRRPVVHGLDGDGRGPGRGAGGERQLPGTVDRGLRGEQRGIERLDGERDRVRLAGAGGDGRRPRRVVRRVADIDLDVATLGERRRVVDGVDRDVEGLRAGRTAGAIVQRDRHRRGAELVGGGREGQSAGGGDRRLRAEQVGVGRENRVRPGLRALVRGPRAAVRDERAVTLRPAVLVDRHVRADRERGVVVDRIDGDGDGHRDGRARRPMSP